MQIKGGLNSGAYEIKPIANLTLHFVEAIQDELIVLKRFWKLKYDDEIDFYLSMVIVITKILGNLIILF